MGLKFNEIVSDPISFDRSGLSGTFASGGSTGTPADITFIRQAGMEMTGQKFEAEPFDI